MRNIFKQLKEFEFALNQLQKVVDLQQWEIANPPKFKPLEETEYGECCFIEVKETVQIIPGYLGYTTLVLKDRIYTFKKGIALTTIKHSDIK